MLGVNQRQLRVYVNWEAERQNRIHDAENCGIRADTERESKDGDRSESRTLRQHPRGESYVLPERFHEPPRCLGPDARFLRLLNDAAVEQVNRALGEVRVAL